MSCVPHKEHSSSSARTGDPLCSHSIHNIRTLNCIKETYRDHLDCGSIIWLGLAVARQAGCWHDDALECNSSISASELVELKDAPLASEGFDILFAYDVHILILVSALWRSLLRYQAL